MIGNGGKYGKELGRMYSNAFSYPKSFLWFRRSQNTYNFLRQKSSYFLWYSSPPVASPRPHGCLDLFQLWILSLNNFPLSSSWVKKSFWLWAVPFVAFLWSKIVPFRFEGGLAYPGSVLIISVWPAWSVLSHFQNWICSLILEASNLFSGSAQSN